MKEVIWYVGHYENHFREIMEVRLQAESKETIRGKQKQLEKDEKRIQELDRLFIRLYEDNVSGVFSCPNPFDGIMSRLLFWDCHT